MRIKIGLGNKGFRVNPKGEVIETKCARRLAGARDGEHGVS